MRDPYLYDDVPVLRNKLGSRSIPLKRNMKRVRHRQGH